MTSNPILNPIIHAPLLADLAGVCYRANIPIEAIKTSATLVLSKKELEWLHTIMKRASGVVGRGAMFVGGEAEDKLIAVCAALVRNFIDARVVSLNTLLDGPTAQPSVILVPNLYVKALARPLPDWKIQQLYDILMARKAGGLLTVGYVEDLTSLKKDYGAVFARHIERNYVIV